MPDVTPKPLRSKANGIINIVGYIGAILGGAMAMVIKFKELETASPWKLLIPYLITSVCMVITIIILFIKIKENKVAEEMHDAMVQGEEQSELIEKIDEDKPLSKNNKISLIILISAIFLWFASFNAVETFWSGYGTYYLNISNYSLFTIVLTIASLISFVPAAMVSDKIGRKWTIIIGLVLVTIALVMIAFVPASAETFIKNDVTYNKTPAILYLCFVIAGIGWAFINCCSYPMVVELASGKNLGRYTGLYYAASMLAQTLTPILAGLLMYKAGKWSILFIYSSIMMACALVVFFFVKNVKTKNVKIKKGLEALDQD